MKSEQELLGILSINENRLDEEWEGQPKLIFLHSVDVADARQLLEEAEREAKVARAELGLRIRENPSDYGLDKATEGSVTQVIETQMSKHQEKIAKRRHDLEVLQAFVEALQHRRSALENKTRLILAGWTGTPKITTEEKQQMDARGRDSTFNRCKLKRKGK